uniref:RGS domain-containing protein n=1 Tax=Amphilophus citrinellus TaxID=61819 RepID=A0A3Q0RE95_AMPCI
MSVAFPFLFDCLLLRFCGSSGSHSHCDLFAQAGESRNHQLKKKTQNLYVNKHTVVFVVFFFFPVALIRLRCLLRAADVRGRLAFLRRRKNSTGVRGNSLEKASQHDDVLAISLIRLLLSYWSDGLTVFRHFLRSEFSEENLDFWLAVERFKRTRPSSKMAARAAKIYDQFISTTAARQVPSDMRLGISSASFQLAQDQIFYLMETDSYPRFLKSRFYTHIIKCFWTKGHRFGCFILS